MILSTLAVGRGWVGFFCGGGGLGGITGGGGGGGGGRIQRVVILIFNGWRGRGVIIFSITVNL